MWTLSDTAAPKRPIETPSTTGTKGSMALLRKHGWRYDKVRNRWYVTRPKGSGRQG